MTDPSLAVLGLTPDAATVKDIKAAEPAPGMAHAASSVASPLTPGALAAVEALRTAIASRARQRIREAWHQLDAEATALGRHDRFLLAMAAFEPGGTGLLADVCTDERLLAHLRDGETTLAQMVLEAWTRQRDVRRIREFITSLNRASSLHAQPACAVAMVAAAAALAAWEPDTANRLVQKAAPALPPGLNTELIAKVDVAMEFGRLLLPLAESEKVFWLSCLQGLPPTGKWSGLDDRRLLLNLLHLCGHQWAGFAILAKTLPPEHWQKLNVALTQLGR